MTSPTFATGAAPRPIPGDRGFLAALALALPAVAVFAYAPQLGVAVHVPASPWLFVLVYPVLEELVFRGLVQGWLLQRPALAAPLVARTWLAGLSAANVVTAALFAAAHLLRSPWPWALATFLPGLVFGWLRERHGGVTAPAIVHVAYNAAVLLGATIGNAMLAGTAIGTHG